MSKEKKIVPITSGSTDKEQPKTTNKSIAENQKKSNLQATENLKNFEQGVLETITMEELYDTVYPPKAAVVDKLIYNGTYLFVGAPKIGKSFLMAQLGYHVSMGLPLWNYQVNQGSVLYLALEDDYGRLQKRLSKMFGIESTSNPFLINSIFRFKSVRPIAIRAFTRIDGIVNVMENNPSILKNSTAPIHLSPYSSTIISNAHTIMRPENRNVRKLTT